MYFLKTVLFQFSIRRSTADTDIVIVFQKKSLWHRYGILTENNISKSSSVPEFGRFVLHGWYSFSYHMLKNRVCLIKDRSTLCKMSCWK